MPPVSGARGVVLVTGAAVAWSTAGYFTRLIPVDLWTLVFWRNVFGGLFIVGVRRRDE